MRSLTLPKTLHAITEQWAISIITTHPVVHKTYHFLETSLYQEFRFPTISKFNYINLF